MNMLERTATGRCGMNEQDKFFSTPYDRFFRPLNGKYREVAAYCIRSLYLRVNGPDADYEYTLTRRDVEDIFVEALRRAPVLEPDGTEDRWLEAASLGDKASALRRQLEDCGWIERYEDPGSMRTAYRFTPRGRQFAAPFAASAMEGPTMTQNTRSTLAHLSAFLESVRQGLPNVVDLMLAVRFSSEIILDFNHIIDELIEQKRQFAESATRELEHARALGESFFDYMDRRFIPDVTIRFNEDSVQRFRQEIIRAVDAARELPDDKKADIEQRLRAYYPSLKTREHPSILLRMLDRIHGHIVRACDARQPELRRETRNFVRRADSLLRHLADVTYETDDESIGQRIAQLMRCDDKAVADRVLADSRVGIPRLRVMLVNPERVRLDERKVRKPVATEVEPELEASPEAMLQKRIQENLAELFRVDAEVIGGFVVERLAGGHRIRASDLPVTDYRSLLATLHATELGAAGRAKTPFRITPLETRFETSFFEADDYLIEYVGEGE